MTTHSSERSLGRNAVVIGGSIAGLMAAQVLGDRFETVTLIDRDALPAGHADRRAVPQGGHGHALLASGLRALEHLFPGLEADLVASGAIPGDVIGSVRWFQHGHYKARFESGLKGVLMSRALLESTIRARVRRSPRVHFVERCHVLGLLASPGSAQVTGIRTRPDLPEDTRMADLVVDASGRESRSPT
jgi:2-polyprenyl-6-methoxyphenol hydroxylase-like FAD-dependent oxidoreductase